MSTYTWSTCRRRQPVLLREAEAIGGGAHARKRRVAGHVRALLTRADATTQVVLLSTKQLSGGSCCRKTRCRKKTPLSLYCQPLPCAFQSGGGLRGGCALQRSVLLHPLCVLSLSCWAPGLLCHSPLCSLRARVGSARAAWAVQRPAAEDGCVRRYTDIARSLLGNRACRWKQSAAMKSGPGCRRRYDR